MLTVEEGETPIQILVCFKIKKMSQHKWGIDNLAWIFYPCRTLPLEASSVLMNLFHSWNNSKKLLEQRPIRNEIEVDSLPLWSPSAVHIDQKKVGGKLSTQLQLQARGIYRFKDLLIVDGGFKGWDLILESGVANRCSRAYANLLGNICRPEVDEWVGTQKSQLVVAPNLLMENSICWEVELPNGDVRSLWELGELQTTPMKTSRLVEEIF